jgi:hypothetical protein
MDLTKNIKNVKLKYIKQKKGEIKMAVSNATYKVGDTYTSQKSKQTGVIKEIVPQANGNVRVRLDVEGKTRWTTWTAKSN